MQDASPRLLDTLHSHPKHLNALADLEVIYRDMNENQKADDIAQRINIILVSMDAQDLKEKAVCLLEQAYLLLFPVDSEYDSLKITDYSMPSSDRLQVVRTHTQNDGKSLPYKTKYHTTENCQMMVDLSKKGIKMLTDISCPDNEITIWTFYMAMAINRLHESYRYLQLDDPEKMLHLTKQVIHLFLSVIHDLESQCNIYVLYRARSYAYIGHILCSRRYNNLEADSLLRNTNYQRLKDIFDDPLLAFRRANELLQDDEVVLNRYGRSLYLMSLRETDQDEKRKLLEKADQILSDSINKHPIKRLLAYSTRMEVYFDMSSLYNMNIKQKQTVLIKAREDGRRSLTEHITSKDVCKLARICQRLSKYPRFYIDGPEFVSRPEYLHEAVQSLHQGLYAKGQTFHLAYTFGTCLNDLGKFRIAVEWMKRAFFLSKHDKSEDCFKIVISYIFTKYTDTVLYGDDAKAKHVFEELLYAFTEIVRKVDNIDIVRNVISEHVYSLHVKHMWSFMRFLRNMSLTEDHVRIAEMLKNILVEKNPLDLSVRILHECRYEPTEIVEVFRTQEFDSLQVKQEIDKLNIWDNSKLFEFDFVVVQSKYDAGWVDCFVLHQLREQMDDKDVSLKGSIFCYCLFVLCFFIALNK
jgi:tetratricopeptide (TPR) repeat protein